VVVRTLLVVAVVVIVAIQHVSRSSAVRGWQERQAAGIACSVVATSAREDLIGDYCAGSDARPARDPAGADD
jgi:hypothetical protein